jgi:hypothetical protein
MEPAAKKSFGKKFRSNAEGNSITPADGMYLDERDLGPELTEENCTPELWEEIRVKNDDKDAF